MGYVAPVKTPVTPAQVAQGLVKAYRNLTGKKPSVTTLGLLLGKLDHETGNFTSFFNNNPGNMRGVSPAGNWTSFTQREVQDGQNVMLKAGDPNNKSRAYNSLAEGLTDYLAQLKAKPHWWAGLQTGTPEGFVQGLTTVPKYFTDSPTVYLTSLKQRIARQLPLAKQYGGGSVIITTVVSGVLFAAGGFLGARAIKRRLS